MTGRPDVDVSGMHIDRLHPYQANPEYRRTRTVESLGMVYQCHYPTRSMQTARGAKQSPFYDRLAARGAYFRDVSGWEGADWYARPGAKPQPELTFGKPSWFAHWAAEHRAAREGVILMDMSFMSKFLVEGRDAGELLNWISANNVDGDAGQITYTQWLDDAGKLQADLTVTKLDEDRYWVVASDTVHRRVHTRMRRAFDDASRVRGRVTGWAQLNMQGPRSRELMQLVTSTDMSNEAFPFRAAREIDIGFARVLCIRITYLGELGYELYIPTEQALHVYDRLVAAGSAGRARARRPQDARVVPDGEGVPRLRPRHRQHRHDPRGRLGFAADLKKPGGFLGKDAVLAQKAAGPLKKRLLQILVKDPNALLFHAEPVLRDGTPVGYIRAASYGHTLGGAVGLAMISADVPIDAKWIEAGRWEVEIANDRFPAVASLKPLYDPENKRVKM